MHQKPGVIVMSYNKSILDTVQSVSVYSSLNTSSLTLIPILPFLFIHGCFATLKCECWIILNYIHTFVTV